MKILLTGPVEGRLTTLFSASAAQEANWVVSAGNFGVWPDPERMDRGSRRHAGKEFALYYLGVKSCSPVVPVLTIAGVHDDHRWLNQRRAANNTEILNNVHWLAQGYKTSIEHGGLPCRVTGLGRAYSEATYNGQYNKRSHRHYTRKDVERACSSGPTDLLVVYEHFDCPGIRNVIFATRPKLILSVKHPRKKVYSEIQGIRVISLGKFENRLVTWENGLFN